MAAPTALVKNIKKLSFPRSTWGGMVTSSARKPEDKHVGEGPVSNNNAPLRHDKSEPIVAFSKPPPSPFLGPLVVLSLLEICSGNDGSDD